MFLFDMQVYVYDGASCNIISSKVKLFSVCVITLRTERPVSLFRRMRCVEWVLADIVPWCQLLD